MLSRAIGYKAEVVILEGRDWKPKPYLREGTTPMGTESTTSAC